MADLEFRIQMLERENERLREELDALRNTPGDSEALPPFCGLTASEDAVLRTLIGKDVATKEQIHFALYAHQVDGGAEPKIIDVFICKLRRKLKGLGITVETVWGRGYRLTPEAKAALRDIVDRYRRRPAATPAPAEAAA